MHLFVRRGREQKGQGLNEDTHFLIPTHHSYHCSQGQQ